MAQAAYRTPPEERGLTARVVDRVEVDWPRSLGFFGAIGAAVALDLVPVPVAIFVASVPFLKLLNRRNAPKAQRFFSQVVDGAAKPVGGDGEGTVHWAAGSRRTGKPNRAPGRRVSRTARSGSRRGDDR